ncbi:hypothetical protein ISCGN_032290 [Ixodes scapularis]|uniref:Uncharacterized protein n=1 Tax=Ixodes scapularis TaxID=6945 RepID=B7P2F8_IXOSC|nr:hypothetical protein IscW_ISCW016351 [Ixodes scapularis]|eukprot:XP_002402332.1 hypothetical protein IscW_ISCW016351 [Ixodes scapularis]
MAHTSNASNLRLCNEHITYKENHRVVNRGNSTVLTTKGTRPSQTPSIKAHPQEADFRTDALDTIEPCFADAPLSFRRRWFRKKYSKVEFQKTPALIIRVPIKLLSHSSRHCLRHVSFFVRRSIGRTKTQ